MHFLANFWVKKSQKTVLPQKTFLSFRVLSSYLVGRSGVLRRSFRHLNIEDISILAKMTELRQKVHIRPLIDAHFGEVSGGPLKIVLDPSNFLCESGSLRRFCRHLNLDCSSILAEMTEFRQNVHIALFGFFQKSLNLHMHILAKFQEGPLKLS